MKELELISKTTPAVVSFNYAEIDAQLDVTLKKYNGLVFTEDTVKECKKTITELKKGQKSLNDFKIKTKKLLTEDITKFEEQCKLLSNKFNTVINPLGVQADDFEVTRIANKRTEIQMIIDTLIDERSLEDKYYEQLVITDAMLNKGPKIKAIKEDLTKQADLLLSQQTIEASNIELIKSKVELAIATYGVPLLDTQYVDMIAIEYMDVIIHQITKDAEALKKRNDEIELQKVIRAEKLEAEKVAAEVRKAERAENERINRERQVELEARRVADRAIWKAQAAEKAKVVAPSPRSVETYEEVTHVSVVEPVNIETEIFVETYKIDGTEAELNVLEDYLNANKYKWSTVEGEN